MCRSFAAALGMVIFLLGPTAEAAAPDLDVGGVGGLLVAPTRVVLGARERSAEVTMVNRGSAVTTYRLSLVSMRMTPDGRLEEVPGEEEPGGTAADLLTFSPRQVTLRPDEAQRVRLLARRPPALAEGEYRSHLVFRAVPDAPSVSTHAADPGASRVRVTMIGLPAVSIPVIVTQGTPTARAGFCEARLKPAAAPGEPRALRCELEREGNASLYGDVRVWLAPAAGERPRVVGLLRGVAVYPPNRIRTVELPLPDLPAGASPSELFVTYEKPDEDGTAVLAEARISGP